MGANALLERAPTKATNVEDMPRELPGMISLLDPSTLVKMVKVMSSLMASSQAGLISIIFGTADLPTKEPLAPEAKEAEAHAKETKAHILEVA